MQKDADVCTTLLMFYRTSDWLNQQNLPKLQVLYIYLSLIDQLTTTVILSYVGSTGKLEAFIVFVYDRCDRLKMFPHKGNCLSK